MRSLTGQPQYGLKKFSITLVFTLIGMGLCPGHAHALRPLLQFSEQFKESRKSVEPPDFYIEEVDITGNELIEQIVRIDSFGIDIKDKNSRKELIKIVEKIESGKMKLIVATNKIDSSVIGYLLYQPLYDNGIYLERLYIIPEYRKTGVGRAFLDCCAGKFRMISTNVRLDESADKLAIEDGMRKTLKAMGFEQEDYDYFVWKRPEAGILDKNLIFDFTTTDPAEHDYNKKWAYLTHTGITELANLEKLKSIYEDISRASEELFCCYKTTYRFPVTWNPAGFILDISDGGEVLYAGDLRIGKEIIHPLSLSLEELKDLKVKLRKNKHIDDDLSGEAREIDITGAKIAGVSINVSMLQDKRIRNFTDISNFSVLMAMAIKYNLPIVLVYDYEPSGNGTNSGPAEDFTKACQGFEKILTSQSNHMLSLLDSEGIKVDFDSNDFKNAILRQIKPAFAYKQEDAQNLKIPSRVLQKAL
ncbi:MAG: GNAT family N-acetyltransferase [Candidatus Omnitrophota bacterium]|jgi:GNAT superfamily N-acetyltransferase